MSLKNKRQHFRFLERSAVFVRAKGLEPPRRLALDPKSSASTNSATPANSGAKVNIFFKY